MQTQENNPKIMDAMKQYHIRWDSQSKDAGECMPLGGRDIGCNVWVENNVLYFYIAQSGALDEKGNMIKAGRCAVTLEPNPFRDSFSQELRLTTGDIRILGKAGGVETEIFLWVDVFEGMIHVEIRSDVEHEVVCSYQNWRQEEFSCQYHDEIRTQGNELLFYHQNQCSEVFDERIAEEGLASIRTLFPDVQKNRISGGMLGAEGLQYTGITREAYAGLPCKSYQFSGKVKKTDLRILLRVICPITEKHYVQELTKCFEDSSTGEQKKRRSEDWWKQFWNRSYIFINRKKADPNDQDWQMGRNYQLFRYMLACNAYGEYPTKFNGGLFTIDPALWGSRRGAKTPDERDWGGIEFTAQNQRHLYWPMLKSGDFDMMKPQFEFYFRILESAIARTSHFFGTKDAACIPEQVDANGLSAYYGKDGLDYPIYVRYHYATSLEFSYMMLKYIEATGETDTERYLAFIDAILNYYDQAYAEKDSKGKRIIFPSTAQETYHKAENIDISEDREINYHPEEVAVTNPADLIYALRAVIKKLTELHLGNRKQQEKWQKLLLELPEVPLEVKKGHTVIAPCEEPKNYVKINCEFPQLYGCFPYQEIGIAGEAAKELSLGRDTYYYAWDSEDQLNYEGWMYSGICAARLGLTQEAYAFMQKKLASAPKRFPAFWGPGFDYTPDHNWGGTGMTGLQEMLLQSLEGQLYLLPAWPKDVDVEFKLWIEEGTYVECEYVGGKLTYRRIKEI